MFDKSSGTQQKPFRARSSGSNDKKPSSDRRFARDDRRPSGRPAAPGQRGVKPGQPFNRDRGSRPAGVTAPRAPGASPARAAALAALSDVLDNGAYTAEAIDRRLSGTTMAGVDRALCTALVYGTLENLLAIDHILSFYLENPDTVEKRVMNILRMAVCQKEWMDRIPDNAIADEAVRLTRQLGLEKLTGLVNGVVRSFLRGDRQVTWPEDPIERMALQSSMPLWITRTLIMDHGEEKTRAMLTERPEKHDMVLRPNMTMLSDGQFEELLKKKAWDTRRGRVPHAYYASGVMQLDRDRDYLAGSFSVQGEASMLAASLACAAPGMQVLDCCAAPGGKTAYMAEMMQGTGRVLAMDIHPHRVELIRAMARRLRLDNIRPIVWDARKPREEYLDRFDVCLLDAPCTGLGEWHQKPDIRYGITEASLAELKETQKQLLDTCSAYVRRGGHLVYATCSIFRDENDRQVQAFLERHKNYRLCPADESVRALYPDQDHGCGTQLLPLSGAGEGFYMARLKRMD